MAENYQLTQKAKKILGNARRIAMHQYSEIIGTHHLLGGIINEFPGDNDRLLGN